MQKLIISKLPSSPTALGFLCKFIAGFAPFDTFDFGPMVQTLTYQLDTENHLVGGLEDRVVGYIGWIRTDASIADGWIASDGPLTPVIDGDAIAITVLAVENGAYILSLVREAKRVHPDLSVYWKRYMLQDETYAGRFVKKSPAR